MVGICASEVVQVKIILKFQIFSFSRMTIPEDKMATVCQYKVDIPNKLATVCMVHQLSYFVVGFDITTSLYSIFSE